MTTPRRDWLKVFAWLGIVALTILFWLSIYKAIVKIGGVG